MTWKILSWYEIFSEDVRYTIKSIFCNDCESYYKPKEFEYEDKCSNCNRTSSNGMNGKAIVLLEIQH